MKRPGVQGFSTLTEMYSAWMEFGVPATFYHYFLTILKNKSKPDQSLLMNKQISSLRSGTHLYLQIKSSIEAREHSLYIITSTLPLLKDQETLTKPLLSSSEERQFLGYKKLFQTKQNPEQRGENRQLRELANHLVIYRKVTLQIIFLIHKWMAELMSLGFEGIFQFLYKNEDYLEEIAEKTMPILNQYQEIFEFNPFFILRKQKANSQHVLVNDYLKISPEYAKNLYEGLKLLAEHHSNLLRHKMLGQKTFMPSQRKLQKSQSVEKVYGNLLNGKEYHMVKDSYLKSQNLLSKQNSTMQNSQINRNKSELRILPSLQTLPLLSYEQKSQAKTNFIERKYPLFFSDNTQNELGKGNTKNFADYLLQRRYSVGNDMLKAKKSIISNDPFKSREMVGKIAHEYENRPVERNESNLSRKNTRPKDIQTSLNADFNKLLRSRNVHEQESPANHLSAGNQSPIYDNKDLAKSQQISNQSQQSTKHEFKVQKNIYPANILRYLRELFRKEIQTEGSSNRMTTQKIQKLAKALLAQRQHITIYKIYHNPNNIKSNQKKPNNDNPVMIAWMVCKMYKDASTLQKTVDVVYLYQFHKSSTLQNSIIAYFAEFGYLTVKQNGNIVHQSNSHDHLELEGAQVVRCKYKVSPFAADQDIKEIVKSNISLKMSRILKYHYYSKTSKYHKYCDHRSKEGTCSINYFFEHVSKVFINNRPHIKVKIDSISRVKQCYKIYHHLNNKTFLIAATTIEDLKQMDKQLQKQHQQEMDQDPSFDEGNQPNHCDFNWVCFEEGKVMRKFVDERNKPIINEFVWIDSNIPEVKSIALDKKEISGSDCLVLSQPYVLAIYGKDDHQGLKSLAVLDFLQ